MMNTQELEEMANKVLLLEETMIETFGSEKGFLKIAIMAGLQDAYNRGRYSIKRRKDEEIKVPLKQVEEELK